LNGLERRHTIVRSEHGNFVTQGTISQRFSYDDQRSRKRSANLLSSDVSGVWWRVVEWKSWWRIWVGGRHWRRRPVPAHISSSLHL